MNIIEIQRRKAYVEYVRSKVSDIKFMGLSFSVFINREGNIKKYIENYIENIPVIKGDDKFNIEKAKILYFNFHTEKKIDGNLPKKIYNAFYKGTAPENDVIHSIHVLFSNDMDYSSFCSKLDNKNPDYLKYINSLKKSENEKYLISDNSALSKEEETLYPKQEYQKKGFDKINYNEVLRKNVILNISLNINESKAINTLNDIIGIVGITGEVIIRSIERGSTILTVEMESSDCDKLLLAYKSGALKRFNVVEVTLKESLISGNDSKIQSRKQRVNLKKKKERERKTKEREELKRKYEELKKEMEQKLREWEERKIEMEQKLRELDVWLKLTMGIEDAELKKVPAYVRKKNLINENNSKIKSPTFKMPCEEKKDHCDGVSLIHSTSAEEHYNYAILLMEKDDIEKAKEHYEFALKINPKYAEAHYNYAILLEEKFNDIEGAKEHYEKALEIKPNDPNVNSKYAYLLFEKFNDIKGAKKHLEKAEKFRTKFSNPTYDPPPIILGPDNRVSKKELSRSHQTKSDNKNKS